MRPLLFIACFFLVTCFAYGQVTEAPIVDEGEGPFPQLIIRGAILINSTGAPPIGPVDVVIENNIIKEVKVVGYPGVPIDTARRSKLEAGKKADIIIIDESQSPLWYWRDQIYG